MRHKLFCTATLVAPLLLTGCMRQMATTEVRPDLASVGVRFVMASEPVRFTDADGTVQTQFVADQPYSGVGGAGFTGGPTEPELDAYHVALWGGGFEGHNVTYRIASLTPGQYTFAFFDRDHGDLMQGWLDVRSTGNGILDTLYEWQNNIPEQKQRLAYDFKINERMKADNPLVFESFARRLRALEQLEQRIGASITAELEAQSARFHKVRDLLHRADILILPGEEAFFQPTTRPAITVEDLTAVRAGGVVSKMVLVADHHDASWKLRRVNELYGDLSRYRLVLKEEVDRFERRKGLFLLTDHLHNHDRRFVENEMHLQRTLGLIDRLNEQILDLQGRRTGLAFVTGLFSPSGAVSALDDEERDLLRELAVLETEKHHVDWLLNEVDDSSVRRVALERRRQGALAAIEQTIGQIEKLGEARTILAKMTRETDVIHRQGDTRLLTTTFLGKNIPLDLRRAVEDESMMTVRLQIGDNVFVPTRTAVTAARQGAPAGSTVAYQPYPMQQMRSSRNAQSKWDADARSATSVMTRPSGPLHGQTTHSRTSTAAFTQPRTGTANAQDTRNFEVNPAHQHGQGSHSRTSTASTRSRTGAGDAQAMPTFAGKPFGQQDEHTMHARGHAGVGHADMQVAEERAVSTSAKKRSDRRHQREVKAQAQRKAQSADKARLARHRASEEQQRDEEQQKKKTAPKDYDCPLIVRFLVPPCWFVSGGGGA